MIHFILSIVKFFKPKKTPDFRTFINEEIISKYKLDFKEVSEEYMGKTVLVKYPYMEDSYLFDFLYNWRNPQHINATLLPIIENAINNTIPVEDSLVGSNGASMLLFEDGLVKTYSASATDLSNPASALPIHDFKEIVTGWRDYLLVKPV